MSQHAVGGVERVEPRLTFPLRQQVLRPHQSLEELALPDDGEPDTATFAVRDEVTGEVLTTANVRRQAAPPVVVEVAAAEGGGADRPTWRLRGMATRPDLRGRGLGRRALEACVAHVAADGGGLLWCSARVPARAFYERAGFAAVGDEFDEPHIGPHVYMYRFVEPPQGGSPP